MDKVAEQLSKLVEDLAASLTDAYKFDDGNASAGLRVRKSAQSAVKALKTLRKTVSLVKEERKAQPCAVVETAV